jgi:hypothetical protein
MHGKGVRHMHRETEVDITAADSWEQAVAQLLEGRLDRSLDVTDCYGACCAASAPCACTSWCGGGGSC